MLGITADGIEHSISDLATSLAIQFKLSDEEIKELLPSGRQSRFRNRVAWAVVYLARAGLLQRSKRGVFQVSSRGRALLQENPGAITIKTLLRYEEFREFRKNSSVEEREPDQDETSDTPEERLEATYKIIREALAAELLETVRKCSPSFFEDVVIDLIVAMGYGGSRQDAERVGRSGDGGIDGIIKEDRLGLDAVYVQAKRWNAAVGRPVVQAFAGGSSHIELEREY